MNQYPSLLSSNISDSSGTDIEPVAQEGADGHDHDDEHGSETTDSCACKAEEYGFDIDCTNQAAMLDALTTLKASGCNTDCSSTECEKNWYIVQAHHDFCDVNSIPGDVEDDFHDFDETCASCEIKRSFVPGAPDCPIPNCYDDSGNEAYVALLENDCSTDCGSTACRDAFFLLVATHDSCEHDTLSAAAEEGLHDFEDLCAMHFCNSGDGSDQLVCDDHGHDHSDSKMASAAATSDVVGATLLISVAAAFMAA